MESSPPRPAPFPKPKQKSKPGEIIHQGEWLNEENWLVSLTVNHLARMAGMEVKRVQAGDRSHQVKLEGNVVATVILEPHQGSPSAFAPLAKALGLTQGIADQNEPNMLVELLTPEPETLQSVNLAAFPRAGSS